MKTILQILILCLLGSGCAYGQFTVSGKVTDNNGQSLPGVNVMIKGTYDGATTDTTGFFKFRSMKQGRQVLAASFIGFKTSEIEIDLTDTLMLVEIKLEEQIGEIKGVIITAGVFETGEIKRPIVLKPMDIATTPSAVGDIYGVMTTLPGTQFVGNEGGLYIRGGEGYETKTFIDGMLVANPYMSKMPDLPTRSRFSPLLFAGTAFSTGGYSAEYGQALSSVVNLKTTGLAEKNQGSVSLMSVGMSGSYARRWDNSSVSGTLQYLNMKPYFALFKQKMEWENPPEQTGGTVLVRKHYGRYGLLKVFGSLDRNNSALYHNYKGDSSEASLIKLKGGNYYLNTVYSDLLAEKWTLKTGLACSYDEKNTVVDQNRLKETAQSFHHKLTVNRDYNEILSVKIGEEASLYKFDRNYYSSDSLRTYDSGFSLGDYALYVEPEIHLNDHFIARTGLRGEYVSLLKEWHVVPRISMAYTIGDYSQISLAYGLFRQRPENQYLVVNQDLKLERATHLILNYQFELDDRILRIELYRKWYKNLVKFTGENNPDPLVYNNSGTGYAQGIDIFWRDSKSVKNLDYWVSCSYIQAKRNYREYRQLRIPTYISPFTFSMVAKYFFSKTNTYAGLTYMYASPKTYYNPSLPFSTGDLTKPYNDLSINITWIRPLLGSYCAFLLNVSNILGFDNVFGFHYSLNPDLKGNYTRYPIVPQSKRFFVVAAYYIF